MLILERHQRSQHKLEQEDRLQGLPCIHSEINTNADELEANADLPTQVFYIRIQLARPTGQRSSGSQVTINLVQQVQCGPECMANT